MDPLAVGGGMVLRQGTLNSVYAKHHCYPIHMLLPVTEMSLTGILTCLRRR